MGYETYDDYLESGEKYEEELERKNYECEQADLYNDDVKCELYDKS